MSLLAVVTVAGVELNPQDVFDGAVTGLVYGFLAIGVILLYRASGVVNFAYGAIGSLAAVLVAKMVIDWGWPYLPALVVGVAASATAAGAIEMTVVRRLFDSARITLFVATIGAAQLVTVLVINVPRVEGFGAAFPSPVTRTWQLTDSVTVHGPQVVALVAIPLLGAGLAWFLDRTIWGIAVTATAANPDASRLAGLSPRKVSTLVWVLAGSLAGITTILAAPLRATPVSSLVQSSGIQLLVIALAVALLARMRSLLVAVVAGVVVGVVERVVFYNWADQSGLMEFVLFALVLCGVLVARRGAAGGDGAWALSSRVAPLPDRLRSHVLVRRMAWGPALIALAVAVVAPLLIDTNAKYFLYSRMALIAIVVVSVTILTGWGGQLSLAQFALAGLGAMTMAGADLHLNLQFLPAVGLAIAVCTAAAVIMGIPSFRVRGMYLAIVTLAFANAAYAWLFHQRIFNGGRDASRYEPDHLHVGALDLGDRRTYYLVCLTALVVVVLLANRLRRSGVGRALVAVRDNECSAAAFTIAPRTTKLAAFAIAGGLAGFAGALLMALLTNARADQFPVDMSLSAVSMAVIGGLASAAGAVLGTLWVVGLPAIFGANETVGLLTSGVGLLVLIMYFPGGLVQVAYAIRGVVVRAVERRLPPAPDRPSSVGLARSPRAARSEDEGPEGAVGLSVHGLTVRFGERTVVDGVDLHVDRDEVVGLIGANGAGKTTIMNAIGGFLPSEGRVELLGRNIGSLPAARRAERGLGRSFQDARLFGDLTVLETVALAHERVLPTHLLSVLTGLPTWRRRDREQLARARDLVDHLGLGTYADHFVGTLSTGTRRICELACILALEPRVICLDEPTAGVAQRETEAFGPLIERVRSDSGASMIVIEHDMPFVMAISDRVYCLETGTIIAEGPPEQVRHDPRVVASYLGTDERAIQRSGAAAPADPAPLVLARRRVGPPSTTTPREKLMPLHPAAQAIVDMMPAGLEMPEITADNVGAIREVMGAMNASSGGTGPALASVEDRTIAGPGGELPIRIYTPDGPAPRPVAMWFHGGGFFAGSIDEHDTACRHLAEEAGSIVVSVGYRLAPEHRHPAAADDCFAALCWVAEHASEIGGDSNALAVAGDSAGGNLAAVVALRARDHGGPDLRLQVLVYPVVDAADTDDDPDREFLVLPRGGKTSALRVYAGDADLGDPDITPINADLAGLPPALIITAEYDVLCLDGEAYAARLREAWVAVTLSQYDGMLHGFFTSGGTFDDAQTAAAEAGAALRQAFGTAS